MSSVFINVEGFIYILLNNNVDSINNFKIKNIEIIWLRKAFIGLNLFIFKIKNVKKNIIKIDKVVV